jgi:hypothetical protein
MSDCGRLRSSDLLRTTFLLMVDLHALGRSIISSTSKDSRSSVDRRRYGLLKQRAWRDD